MDKPLFIDQGLEWFKDQEVEVTILDMMCELGWERTRAKFVLKILFKKGLIYKTQQGNNRTPTLWAVTQS
ncbi:MAG: hypothetical protein FGM60_04485 [Candidatus Planktophila sp.]|nr:hypothetical protein [Candidatus Planktophila sp.]